MCSVSWVTMALTNFLSFVQIFAVLADTCSSFSCVPCAFMTLVIMALTNFLPFVALINLRLYAISYNPCSASQLHKHVR